MSVLLLSRQTKRADYSRVRDDETAARNHPNCYLAFVPLLNKTHATFGAIRRAEF
jgi:hypothetical protein